MHGTLYLRRPLENARELIAWAKSQGFKTTVPAGDMHVTVVYSKTPCLWPSARDEQLAVHSKKGRSVEPLGDGGAVVLRFENDTLSARQAELLSEYGAVSDFPGYIPHVTLSWDASDVDLDEVIPYAGPLVFGPEVLRVIKPDWKDGLVEKARDFDESEVSRKPKGQRDGGQFASEGGGPGGTDEQESGMSDDDKSYLRRLINDLGKDDWSSEQWARLKETADKAVDAPAEYSSVIRRAMEYHRAFSEGSELDRLKALRTKLGISMNLQKDADTFTKGNIVKVDEGLGLVFGWGIVCKVDGADYYDLQGDHIPEHAMLKATADFMVKSRVNKEMHVGKAQGTVVFSFPLTSDIAKAMGIASDQTGWMIAVKPDNPDALAKFKDGTYTGFSIGGSRIKDKEID